ncbi:MAG: nuclear transport factor 2 family protein [Bacteroidota bacterium]
MDKYNSTKAFLEAFQEAWSTQNTAAVLTFFADDLQFEDIPIGLRAKNKTELEGVLHTTFGGVPDFKMEIFDYHEGPGFLVTQWKQTGTMTVDGYGLSLKNFPYQTITTSIIQRDTNGLITSLTDNWDTSIFFRK